MAITNHTLTSSWLQQARYDDQTRSLDVVTAAGGTYRFANVPPEVVEELVGGGSPGRAFHGVLQGYRT